MWCYWLPFPSMVNSEGPCELHTSPWFQLRPCWSSFTAQLLSLPAKHSLINTLHGNLHLRIRFPENPVYGRFFFFFCKIYINTKQKNELSLKSIFYFIHENLGKLSLFLLYNFSIAGWKIRNYWTCVSYVFLTLWSKTVREKSAA